MPHAVCARALKISLEESRDDFAVSCTQERAISSLIFVCRNTNVRTIEGALNVLTTTTRRWYCYPRWAFVDTAAILDDRGQARRAKGEMLSDCAGGKKKEGKRKRKKKRRRSEIDAQMEDRCPIKRYIRGSMSLANWHFPSSVSDTINSSKQIWETLYRSL